MNIDEVSALRFVVLEYQSRPATRLLQGQPGDDSAGGQSGAGSGLKSSLLLSRSSALKAPEANEGESFDSTKSRRLRVLETYLSERQYICKIKDLIIGYLCELHGPRPDTRDGSGDNSLDGSSASRHHKVLSRAFPDLAGLQTKTSDRWIGQEVQSLEIKFQQLLQGSGWPEDDSSPHLERSWYRTQLVELVHTMQSVLSVAETHPKLMTSHAMASWFNLMGQVKFLSRLDMVRLPG